jgi:transposase-like protein
MNTASTGSNGQAQKPVTEVKPKATRRRFTAEYKRRILREAAACSKPGELGALLRREGLYSSHLATWNAQAERGELAGLRPRKRGPKTKERNPLEARVRELERELTKARKRAQRAEGLVEVQKKVAELFGETLPMVTDEELDEFTRRSS